MPEVRDLPQFVQRGQQAFVQRAHAAASGLAQVVAQSRGRTHDIDPALLVDKGYDLVTRAVENQRRLTKLLLASSDSAGRSLAEQRAYQRRVVKRARSAGARVSAARVSTPGQTALQLAVQTTSIGVKVAAEVARENIVDARETVARQHALAKTMTRQNLAATRAVVGLSRSERPVASAPAVADPGSTGAGSVAVDYELWKKPTLVSEARNRGLATSGTVRDLRTRLSAPHG